MVSTCLSLAVCVLYYQLLLFYMIIVLSLKNKYTNIPYHTMSVRLSVCVSGAKLVPLCVLLEASASRLCQRCTRLWRSALARPEEDQRQDQWCVNSHIAVGPGAENGHISAWNARVPTGQYFSDESPMKMGIFSRKIVPLLAIRSQVPVSAGRFYIYSTYIFY